MAFRVHSLLTCVRVARPALRPTIPQTCYGVSHAFRAPVLGVFRSVSTIAHRPKEPEEETLRGGEDPTLSLTERAIKKLASVAASESNPNLALRVAVEPGGCHGYQYKIELTEEQDDDDLCVAANKHFHRGCTIDYVTELIGSQFAIRDNPQAKGSGCGCGVSWEPND